jgi:hypothetical protein
MILCAERFDREQPAPLLPTLGDLSASSPAGGATFPSGDWAERQTQMRGFDTMTLFADRHGRRMVSRARTTTS